MNRTDSTQLSQFVAYAQKRFEVPLLGGLLRRCSTAAGHSLPRRRAEFGLGRSGSHPQLAAMTSRNQIVSVAAVGGLSAGDHFGHTLAP